MLLKDSLEVKGYEVGEATNGREALDRLAARAPDVVLLDVMMPEMNGYETCRILKGDPATAAIPDFDYGLERPRRTPQWDKGRR